ncbi:hypothetical protein ACQR3P_29375 [Rhodococcus sp. IEGM1300]
MKFSYFYDLDKNHAVVYDLKQDTIVTLTDGRIALTFDASVSETVNGTVLKQEKQKKTFVFMPDDTNLDLHELTVSRVFIAEQGKWILEVKNRQDDNESITLGILTDTKKQPVLLEVEHEDDYEAFAQANTLSRIASEYSPPLVSQTRFDYRFEGAGLPEEITSTTARYDENRQAVVLSDMVLTLAPLSLAKAQFEVSMQILPESVDPAEGTSHLFTVDIEGLGRVEVMKDKMQYTGELIGSRPVTALWPKPLSLEDLSSYYIHPEAKLSVIGDGAKELAVTWNGVALKAPYNPKTQRPGSVSIKSGKKVGV